MQSLSGRDLLSLSDLNTAELAELLAFAADLKAGKSQPQFPNKVLGLLFRKASTRTRVSFSVAMYQLGGQVLDLNSNVTQIGRGEPTSDTARVLDRYLDVVAIRTYGQAEIEEFADYASIPVINALTDLEHPCQILADLLTIQEVFGDLKGLTLTYLGDGNNVAHSLLLGCAMVGHERTYCFPRRLRPRPHHRPESQRTDDRRWQNHDHAGPRSCRKRGPGALHRCLGQHGARVAGRPALAGVSALPGQCRFAV
jgi:ornithine carbamoyltransferase